MKQKLQQVEAPTIVHRRYRSVERLGKGAEGVVLRVIDNESPERALVAKVFPKETTDPGSFRAEFALLARLALPGVVRVHDLCRDELTLAPFIVEDFVPGVSADTYLRAAPEESRSQRLTWLIAKTAQALSGLHDAGFVHGDLKPAHVRVTPEGEVVLLDLGSASARAAPATGGTPGFIAPECLAGARANVSSDLFALGATAWAAASGRIPVPGMRTSRAQLPWLQGQVSQLIEALLSIIPEQRPRDASEVLARLGRVAPELARSSNFLSPIGRESELSLLLEQPTARVRYLVGPSGIGKSHLLREYWTRTLLSGRSARRIGFPESDEVSVGRWIAFFRGELPAFPSGEGETNATLILDGIDEAPPELRQALEAYRCSRTAANWQVVAACREAPAGAPCIELSALCDASTRKLAESLGLTQAADIDAAVLLSRGNPGWLLASRGGAPLTREMALDRVRGLSSAARRLLSAVAISNGELPESAAERLLGSGSGSTPLVLAEAFESSLLVRRVTVACTVYALPSARLAGELAQALSDSDISDALAEVLLECEAISAQRLLSVAEAPYPPRLREALLERAAELARVSGMQSVEISALLALLACTHQRDPVRLLRLERLTRDTSRQSGHPRVLQWLEEAANGNPALRPLVLRRAAERAARQGEHSRASELIERALDTAVSSQDRTAEGLVRASAGAILLYRADWTHAETELERAYLLLSEVVGADPEELARLDHNRGVVALYAGRLRGAERCFRDSLATKRTLGDLGGVRVCLLNLGLTWTRLGQFAEAESALDEAIDLARSLRQQSGELWSLNARCELELQRGNAGQAEHWLARAQALTEGQPAVVLADLRLLEARIALARGDGRGALECLDSLDPELMGSDASLEGRSQLARGEAVLCVLPARPRLAARLALQAIRLARAARLPDLEQSAKTLLIRARPPSKAPNRSYAEAVETALDGGEWQMLRELSSGAPAESSILRLCRLAIERTAAERAFVLACDPGGHLIKAWGCDLDGFALENARERASESLYPDLLRDSAGIYQREVNGGSRAASRVASVSGGSVAIVLEHRFRTAHFDGLRAEELERWATLAALVVRFDGTRSEAPTEQAVAGALLDGPSTRLPLRPARRKFPEIVGESVALEKALCRLDAAIDSALPVLIRGETGTGKELFAQALHAHGPRADGALVAVNCAAIADSLFETELFGHARGAFTGAERVRPGLIAEAEGGTLFLDEIAELSLARQATLLRLLETGRYRAVGSDREHPASLRIIAATNRDLDRAVEGGTFRSDLWFRLNVLEIRVPPLRERRDDIPLLLDTFLRRSKTGGTLQPSALELLCSYDWPGNVRELQHVVERLLAFGARQIEVSDLPKRLRQLTPRSASRSSTPILQTAVVPEVPQAPKVPEREEVLRAIASSDGNITHAARLLGLTRQGLKKKMVRLGLRANKEGV